MPNWIIKKIDFMHFCIKSTPYGRKLRKTVRRRLKLEKIGPEVVQIKKMLLFSKSETVFESEQEHLGTSKKRKKSI